MGQVYTVRFSYYGTDGTWRTWHHKSMVDGSRSFDTPEEAEEFAKNGWKEYEKFHYYCTEHIDIDSLIDHIRLCKRERPHAECSDESIIGSYSR